MIKENQGSKEDTTTEGRSFLVKHYKVEQRTKINLKDWDPEDKSAFPGDKEEGEKVFAKLTRELNELESLLYAEHKHKVLVIFQAMDSGGKDGTIKAVFQEVSPQGVNIASFKVPTEEELDHDYLWRVHERTPGKGEIVCFNRSHYEDVLTVRVHKLVPEEVWSRRFQQINDFERMLAEEGTTILKFYLNISKDEQKKRLQERLDDPQKSWKFKLGDLKERELWNEYMKAYQDVLSKTSTSCAPWYIIPSNKNWYRNLCVITVLVEALKKLDMQYPRLEKKLEKILIE